MKIISLQAENFKKLHAVEITPEGNFVQITGRNGQGKTSTLDAIWVALAGTGVAPAQPIRKGAESAKIRLDLGEIVVTRLFKAGEKGTFTSSITVESAEGARFPSPQKMLDSLLGSLSFDPLAFSRMDDKQQFDELRKFVPDVDFVAIDKTNKADYDKRTDINRSHKEKKAGADLIKPTPEPKAPVDESALVEKMRAAGESNADIEKRRANRATMADSIDADLKTVANLEDQVTIVRAKIAEYNERIAIRREKLRAAPQLADPIDTSAIAAELNEARETNKTHAVWKIAQKARADLLAEVVSLTKASEILSEQIKDRNAAKLAKIAAAELPIAGISFGDGEVLLNDLPFDQASDAEKLRTSVAIAMAANSKLPVVLIRDGSLLDEDGLRLVAEMADAKGAQVWIERVASDSSVGIVLEDGYVKESSAGSTDHPSVDTSGSAETQDGDHAASGPDENPQGESDDDGELI
jgi:hypothetical protein